MFKRKLSLSLIVGLIALPITAVFTYPLLPQLQSHIVGYFGADAINHAWSVWWFKNALVTLQQSPINLNYIYYPAEVVHPLVLATAWVKVAGFAFIEQISPITLYNLHLFLSYPLTWVITTLLCYEVTDDEVSAIIGGEIFTFCLHRTTHALYGHFTHALAYSYPLLVLALWYQLKRPSWKRGLLLVIALFIILTTDLMAVAFFAAPIIVSMIIFFWNKKNWFKTLWPFAVAFCIILPFAWPLIAANISGGLGWYGADGVGEFSADALGLFIPPPDHLLSRAIPSLKAASEQVYWLGRSENIVYAGWITLILAAIAIVKVANKERWITYWFSVTAVATLFSLGPLLRVAGKFIEINSVPVIMPYAILIQIPFMSWGRTPARLHLTAMLGLAILAAFGIRWLLQTFKFSTRQGWRIGFILLGLILLDSVGPYPWPMASTAVPAGFDTIANDTRNIAVLDIPVTDYTAAKYHLLYQMTHRHPLVGGFRVRLPEYASEEMLEIEAFALDEGNPTKLADAGIGYIVLHKQFFNEDAAEVESFLIQSVGDPFYADEIVSLFAVPNSKEIAPSPLNKK